jgi:hypothetical protein
MKSGYYKYANGTRQKVGNKIDSNSPNRKSLLEFSHHEIQETLKKIKLPTIGLQAITAS